MRIFVKYLWNSRTVSHWWVNMSVVNCLGVLLGVLFGTQEKNRQRHHDTEYECKHCIYKYTQVCIWMLQSIFNSIQPLDLKTHISHSPLSLVTVNDLCSLRRLWAIRRTCSQLQLGGSAGNLSPCSSFTQRPVPESRFSNEKVFLLVCSSWNEDVIWWHYRPFQFRRYMVDHN